MKKSNIWSRLLSFLRLKSNQPSDAVIDCIALVFWQGEWADPKAMQAVSAACLRFAPMYWCISSSNRIDAVFAKTPENIAKVQGLIAMVEDGSFAAEYTEDIRLGIHSGLMMAIRDRNGVFPIGMAIVEAYKNSEKASAENPCVGYPSATSTPLI